MSEIKVEYKKVIHNLEKLANMDLTNAMELCGITVENNAKEIITTDHIIKTGDLRRSIKHEIIDDHTVEIGSNLEYAPYVEVGTGIYALNGDGRKDVPWHYQTADGQWHTTYGQKPRLYMKRALDASENDITAIINNEIRRLINNA